MLCKLISQGDEGGAEQETALVEGVGQAHDAGPDDAVAQVERGAGKGRRRQGVGGAGGGTL